MKRDGYIIEEIIEQTNLEEAFDDVVKGTLRKSLSEGKWLLAHRDEFLKSVREEIVSGKISLMPVHRAPTEEELRTGGYHEKEICEAGKKRLLQVYCMAARIKINAVMSPVDKHLRPRYIRTTSASIKKRGMHDLMQYIRRDMKQDVSILYWYKCDVKKCYDTVKHKFVLYALNRTFKDKKLIAILAYFLATMPGGERMSMGMRSSQGLVNHLLSVHLDHFLKERYGVRHFYRYMDDFVVGASDKRFLWLVRDKVHEHIESIGQTIKHNERVFPIDTGIDFLGYVIFPTHTLLRKRVKKIFCQKLKKVKSRKRRVEIVGSLIGMAKHADCKHLLKKLLTKKEMIKFSDLGLTYTPKDGKKRFNGDRVRISAIVNVEIEIHDFERDVKTAQGDGRYLVSFKDTRTGQFAKFFTNSDEMKSMLDAMAAKGDVFRILTIIRSEPFQGGGGTRYYFT